jgi:hypothetical protein
MSWIPWLWPWVSPEEFSRSALTNTVLTQIVGIRQLWRPTSLHGVHGVLCLYFCVLVTSSSHSLMHWMPLRTWMVPIGGCWSLWLIRVGSVQMIPGWCWFQASVAARKCHYTQGASESFQPQSAEKRTIQNHKYSPSSCPEGVPPGNRTAQAARKGAGLGSSSATWTARATGFHQDKNVIEWDV